MPPTIIEKQQERPMKECCAVASGSLTLGETQVLWDINAGFSSGEVVLITGHNGAGKTSLLRIIGGELPLNRGSLVRREQLRTVFLPDSPWVYDALTVWEHCDFFAKLWGTKFDVDSFLHRHRLHKYRGVYGADLSLGLKQRLLFALACLGEPGMILLDEPLNALDHRTIEEFACHIENLAANGCCVVIVSHHQKKVRRIFTREIRLERGRIISDSFIHHEKPSSSDMPTDIKSQ